MESRSFISRMVCIRKEWKRIQGGRWNTSFTLTWAAWIYSIWISVRRKNTWWRILCIGWSWNQPLGSLPCVEIRKGKWQILVSEVPKLLLKLVQICPQTPTLRVTLAKGPKDESSKRLPLQMVLDSLWGMYHIFAHKWNGEQERAGAGLTYLNFSASWLIKYKSSSCYCQFNIYPIQSSSPR